MPQKCDCPPAVPLHRPDCPDPQGRPQRGVGYRSVQARAVAWLEAACQESFRESLTSLLATPSCTGRQSVALLDPGRGVERARWRCDLAYQLTGPRRAVARSGSRREISASNAICLGIDGRLRPAVDIGECDSARPRPMNRSPRTVWAVRRDWPDIAHEFIGPDGLEQEAFARLEQDIARLQCSPHRPRLSVVPIGSDEFWSHAEHRRNCTDSGCPAVVVWEAL